MTSRIGDVRRDAVDPLQRIQLDRGRAGFGIGRRFQNQAAAVESVQRFHRQYRPGDIAGLGFHRSDLRGIHPRSRIHGKGSEAIDHKRGLVD